jgi:hypothetical protein
MHYKLVKKNPLTRYSMYFDPAENCVNYAEDIVTRYEQFIWHYTKQEWFSLGFARLSSIVEALKDKKNYDENVEDKNGLVKFVKREDVEWSHTVRNWVKIA